VLKIIDITLVCLIGLLIGIAACVAVGAYTAWIFANIIREILNELH
jgi:hypothetical protein